MSYIETLQSNVKSPDGEQYSVDLGQYTILIGSNESGKSAIAESAQLARTGSAYGLLYRDKPIKDGTLLSTLIPSEEGCSVTATLNSGEVCSWSLTPGKRPERNGPNGSVLSVAELHGIMAGSPETQAKFFWRVLCKPLKVQDLLEKLPDELHEALVLVCPVDGRDISLADLIEKIGKFQREQNSVATAGRIALESLGGIRNISDEELEGAWSTLHRAMLRDVLRELYAEHRADASLQAREVLRHLVKMLGGEEAIDRIPETKDVGTDLSEVLINRRLSRAAVAAKRGENHAITLKEGLKRLKISILGLMFEAIDWAADKFIDGVSEYLPGSEKLVFSVNLPSRTLSIGLRRGDVEYIALSGSTEARVLAAIAATLSDENDLLVVDDRMWDGATLGKTLGALEGARCQVLVMSTIKPKGRRRAAWNYVEVNREEGEPLGVENGGE